MASPRASASASVVRDVSIAVRRGEAVGLLGPNGAGKTTVFTMIMGLVKPDAGEILLDGRADHPPAAVPARPARHRLPAAGALDLSRPQRRAATSWPCSKATCSAQGERKARLEVAARRIRHRAPAPSPTRWRCRAASGGASRSPGRWPPTRSSCCSTSPLPASIRSRWPRSRAWCAQLTQRGIGVLITDHSVRETLSLVDRAYLIHGGKVMIQGKPETITADPEARRVYLGETFSSLSARSRDIGTELAHAACPAARIMRHGPLGHGAGDGLELRKGLDVMALSPRLEFRQAQSLTLTPQLMQSIRLLQLSHLELNAFVDTELLRNPLLEREDGASRRGRAGRAPERSDRDQRLRGHRRSRRPHPDRRLHRRWLRHRGRERLSRAGRRRTSSTRRAGSTATASSEGGEAPDIDQFVAAAPDAARSSRRRRPA